MGKKSMFWGLLFLLIGAIIVIQTVFKIDLPIMRLLFGFFLIYLGVKVIFGSFGVRLSGFNVERVSKNAESVFAEGNLNFRNSDGSKNFNYSTAFSSNELDLREFSVEELSQPIRISTGFGKVTVLTPSHVPIKAHISAGFAEVRIRGQKVGAFGETDFQTPGWTQDKPHLSMDIQVGFGEVVVE